MDSRITKNILTTDKVEIVCPKHGVFVQCMANHLRGEGCPKCQKSKGEILVEEWLKARDTQYVSLYKIIVPKSINPSGFAYVDFYIPALNCFIEYNGRLHYMPVKAFGGEIEFNRQLARDNYLRLYCLQHDIKLIEIKYSDNVNKILNEEL